MVKVNDKVVEIDHFPNGEMKIAPCCIGIKPKNKIISIELFYENNEDLLSLMFVKFYLDETFPDFNKELIMPYIPYERMDRQTKNQMFTSKYFGQFINSLNFSCIYVTDPHSNVSTAVLNRVQEFPIIYYINSIFKRKNIDYIFYPDNGAKKKYVEILEDIKIPYFYGDKHRDLDTGKITDYNVFNAPDLNEKTVLIVDDLCVKGYTTLFAAKKLKELGAKEVYFYCSHCEPAIFDGELLNTDYVDKIYTTRSMIRKEHPKIEVL